MTKLINKSTSDFSVPASKTNSNSPLTRVPDIYAPPLQRASGPQAPTLPAMTGIRRTRLQTLSTILEKSSSTKEACEIFTHELQGMAKNAGDVATILSQVIRHCKADTPIHQHAQKESITLYYGQWTAFFRKIAADAQWLTNRWGGSLWLPTDIQATAEGLFGNSEPSLYVLMLVDITKAAQAKGINLRSLWANNGELRVAMKKNASQYLTHELVNGIIQSINGASVEKTLDTPKKGPQDRTAINLASGTEKANSDRLDTKRSVQDPNGRAPIASMSHSLPKILGNTTPKNNGAPEQPQPSPLTKVAQKKSTFNQMNSEEASYYNIYQKIIRNLSSNHITELRNDALQYLEMAESDKARFDYALANLKGREDQIKQIHDQGKTLLDEMSNRMKGKSEQGVLAGVLASTGTAYVTGITSLLDSVLQASSTSQGKVTVKELQAQRAEAVDKVSKAKERLQTLGKVESARLIHQRHEEARSHRQKLLDLLSEANERAI
ncbi:hypothetical protein FANTH_2128 [Fusarium anthophilum]|uniref:Uncharacterized protein n=1 Tax=Fusarium anthophilum TaxID=48485 RepID=A0A8H4ZUA9_9HYPO|nr:hypothetical protein FANTH_2128 [Fusarium anthophilum]